MYIIKNSVYLISENCIMKTIAALILLSVSLAEGSNTFWGENCILDDQCMKPWSFCDKSFGLTDLDGQCRPYVWVWLLLAGVIVVLLGSGIACLLCGICKCIYKGIR